MSAADRCFVDSNIWIYAATRAEEVPPDTRHEAARHLIESIEPDLPVQVINEVSINLIRKFKFSEAHIQTLIRSFYQKYTVYPLDADILLKASTLRTRYRFSFWDSIVVGTALQHQCRILYTEDMGNKLTVNDTLTIINPFHQMAN
jgi:predicted nucleic acid-binding protein